MSFERLIADHGRIDRYIAELRVLSASPLCDTPSVVGALAMLALELREHLAAEDSFIYPAIIEDRQGSADMARGFVTEFASLREDWALFLSEWTGDCIEADWDSFRYEMDAMSARLSVRVERENMLLYPTALQNGFIQLREDFYLI